MNTHTFTSTPKRTHKCLLRRSSIKTRKLIPPRSPRLMWTRARLKRNKTFFSVRFVAHPHSSSLFAAVATLDFPELFLHRLLYSKSLSSVRTLGFNLPSQAQIYTGDSLHPSSVTSSSLHVNTTNSPHNYIQLNYTASVMLDSSWVLLWCTNDGMLKYRDLSCNSGLCVSSHVCRCLVRRAPKMPAMFNWFWNDDPFPPNLSWKLHHQCQQSLQINCCSSSSRRKRSLAAYFAQSPTHPLESLNIHTILVADIMVIITFSPFLYTRLTLAQQFGCRYIVTKYEEGRRNPATGIITQLNRFNQPMSTSAATDLRVTRGGVVKPN